MEDGAVAMAWLRDPGALRDLRIDADRLVVIGHSMRGHVTASVAAGDRLVVGVALISPASIGDAFGTLLSDEAAHVLGDDVGDGLHILAGTSPRVLADEASGDPERWQLAGHASAIADRPVPWSPPTTGSRPAALLLARRSRLRGS